MAWTFEYDEAALRDLKKLDRQVQREILDFMDKRIAGAQGLDWPRAMTTGPEPQSLGRDGPLILLEAAAIWLPLFSWTYTLPNFQVFCLDDVATVPGGVPPHGFYPAPIFYPDRFSSLVFRVSTFELPANLEPVFPPAGGANCWS